MLIAAKCGTGNSNRTRADDIKVAFLLENGRARSAAQSRDLEEDKRSLGVDGVGDLVPVESQISDLAKQWEDVNSTRTGFHPAICASFQIPGKCTIPPACGAMRVPSDTMSVPGTVARCA
jgi:hypothetical protein